MWSDLLSFFSAGQEFGTLWLNGESVNKMVAKEGWAHVRKVRPSSNSNPASESMGKLKPPLTYLSQIPGLFLTNRQNNQAREGEQSPELEDLTALEQEAQAAKRGMYSEGGAATRDVKVRPWVASGVVCEVGLCGVIGVGGGFRALDRSLTCLYITVGGQLGGAPAADQGQAHQDDHRIRPVRAPCLNPMHGTYKSTK